MLPDLRFIIGSVLATAVLGVTALGLFFTVRLAQETKSGPFQVIRPLAYTAPGESQSSPAARPSELVQQPGGPFAQIPADGSVTAQAPAAPEPANATPAEETTSENADDHAAVDERAVVDPPLSPEGEPLPSEADSAPATPATVAASPADTTSPSDTASPADTASPSDTASPEDTASPSDTVVPAADTTGSIPATAGATKAKRAPAAKAKKAKRAVRKTAARPRQKAQPGNVVAPTASTGYPVTIERTPNAGARSKSGGGFPFGD